MGTIDFKNNSAKYHPKPILNDGALGFFEEVVVVIAQQLFSYRQLSRLRKSATAAGSSQRSCTVSCVGWL